MYDGHGPVDSNHLISVSGVFNNLCHVVCTNSIPVCLCRPYVYKVIFNVSGVMRVRRYVAPRVPYPSIGPKIPRTSTTLHMLRQISETIQDVVWHHGNSGSLGFPPCSNMVSSFIFFFSLCWAISGLTKLQLQGWLHRQLSPFLQGTPRASHAHSSLPTSFIHGLGCRKTPSSAHCCALVICRQHMFLNRLSTSLRSAASNDRAAIVRSPPSTPLRQPIVCRFNLSTRTGF